MILLSAVIFTSFRPQGNLDELTEKIINLLTKYADDLPEEKVYLHFDKGYYAAGDDIWFSVFLTAGSPDILSPLSKVVYVDLLDNEGKLIEQKTVRVSEGHGKGDFQLASFFKEGQYHIKAYSTWIRGFGDDHVFSHSFQIFDPANADFQPSVAFTHNANGNNIDYQASIKAVNKSLQPIKNTTLNYMVVSKNREIKKGTIKLDNDGSADLKLALSKSDLNNAAYLRLVMEENEDFQITRHFQMPFPESMIDLQFLPEGGDIIEGFANKVAFRAAYPDGSPAQVKGVLSAGDFEEAFSTNANGLGTLSFTPDASKKYTASIYSGEDKVSVDFPQIKNKGLNLTVDNRHPQLLNLLIQAKDYQSIDSNHEALLVVHARGRIGYMQKLNMQGGVTGARVNKSQLATGINQVTLFSGEGQPLVERLVYVDFADNVKINIDPIEKQLKERSRNRIGLSIDTENFEGGKYSVSITDATNPTVDAGSNIITYLKVSSELKGRISDQEIFKNGSIDAEAVDLIMLTHGWRRFDWNKVLEESFKNDSYIEQGINVMGTISPKFKTKRGLEGGTINVFTKGREDDLLMTEFSDSGKFIIDDLDFQDTATLVVVAQDRKQKKDVNITIDQPASKYEKWQGFQPLLHSYVVSPAFKSFLETADKRRQTNIAYSDPEMVDLDEFVVKTKRLEEEKDGITRMYGQGDRVLKPADVPGAESFNTIFEMIAGRIPGVRVIPSMMDPKITIRGQGSMSVVEPLFLLDNMQVDKAVINTINPRDVETIEAFTDGASNAIFGSAGAGGVIAVYTKIGGASFSPEEGVLHTKYPGYSTAREFYVPKYDEEPSAKPDYRSTLYWNPLVEFTGKKAEIEFFNNDISDKFKVVVQGIDKFGRLSYAEKIIE